MHRKAKLDFCSKAVEENEEIEADFFMSEPADAHALSSLDDRIPPDYIEFLRMTDGADIAQCTFCGTEEAQLSKLGKARESYSGIYDVNEWLPFGWDAGGNPFLFDKNGRVGRGDVHGNAEPQIMAESFGDFIENTVVGERYANLNQSAPDNDPWYAFLCSCGWANDKAEQGGVE